jgi:hypothetical protein
MLTAIKQIGDFVDIEHPQKAVDAKVILIKVNTKPINLWVLNLMI